MVLAYKLSKERNRKKKIRTLIHPLTMIFHQSYRIFSYLFEGFKVELIGPNYRAFNDLENKVLFPIFFLSIWYP